MLFSLVSTLILISTEAEIRPFKILFLGDSLTAGYGLQMNSAYPDLVAQQLSKELKYPVQAINAGVSGDTSAGGLRRLKWQLKSKPDFVFIALGANDMLRGIPPEKTEENLSQIVRELRQRNIPVALTSLLAAGNLGREYEKQFNDVYSNLEKKEKIPRMGFLLEGVARVPELNLEDGIHPNIEGQKKIANSVSAFLKPIIQKLISEKPKDQHDQN